MNTPNLTKLATGIFTPSVQRIAQGSTDKGPLLGSTVHMIGSTEGFIGNRLPATT